LEQPAGGFAERRPCATPVARTVSEPRDHNQGAGIQFLGVGIRDTLDPRLRSAV
jgi:hypothetical protein